MLNRRHLLLTAGAGAALAGVEPAMAKATGPERRLSAAFERFFDQTLQESPETASSLGLDTGAHADLKSKLHQASVADLERHKQITADWLAQLRAIDRKALSGMPAVNYDSVFYDVKTTDA
ncbi:MAG TPA: DUF885 domain-containing protein, partial [Phenylobacterium sp.]|nr:DUF885 domain-containing protein [Phenylobacterium sp.]